MTTTPSTSDLRDAWRSVAAGTATRRPRDLAADLDRTEAELLAAATPDDGVRRLRPVWAELLHALPAVGEVMALTRNDHAVHEKHGTFGNIGGMGQTMLVLNKEIDLRIFLSSWAYGFDVSVETSHGPRRSLQIFDAHGEAVIKIYRTEKTDSEAFDALCARLHDVDATGPISVQPVDAPEPAAPDDAVDLNTLRDGWRELTDVHKFRDLLRSAGAERHQALRLVGQEFAEEVAPDALNRVLTLAADRKVPIMVFVGNRGCIQIHTGPVERIVEMKGYLNVLDPGFNLHVKADSTANAWVVRKPQADGTVTALELYDADNQNFAILYGARPFGMAESEDWRALLETLPRVASQETEAAE